ncbi:hypothetical protein QFC21_003555 [Naganishia friedmannii]|uniref:Uncharacterized protein n=1 Tax=Naganishia friedmannii TaxID=89922 RepID=A0ACC2VNP5_9TREE|nr:hypothetical protein QFC21_003555 [Naganishia friedmannii]
MEYESVSQAKRLGQVVSSVIFCFLTAGVVFGYAELKPVLVDNQVYGELCEDGKGYCNASDIRMNFMFTLATVVTNGVALPIGSLLDKFGPQKTAIGGSIVFLLGNVVFGLQMSKGVFDTYIIGYVLLALGSPAIFLSQFHLSNAFPAYSGGAIPALGRGAEHAYFLLGIHYDSSPTSPLIHGPDEDDGFDELAGARSPRHLHNHLSFDQDPVASGFSRLSYPVHAVATDDEYESAKALDAGKGDAVVGVMYGKGVKEQASSSWFWLIAVYLFVQMRTTLEATITAPQLIGIGFLVVLRPLFYTYVSHFFAKVFGFVTFGRLYGLAMTISGVLGLLLTPMDIVTQKQLNGNYNPINITLVVVGALTNMAVAVRLYMHTARGKIALDGQ